MRPDKRFVQVFMPGRTHEPLGRRKYWPIYEAAAKHGLHIMSHAFGSYGYPITGAGQASYYVEEHVGPAQAVQANVISLVAEGVFEQFPTLKFVSVENGFGWIPSLMWRMDATYKLLKDEVPHLKRLPSEYIREHVYLTTQPVEEPHKPQQFVQLLEHFGDMTSNILFASDYPHWDSDDPDFALPNDPVGRRRSRRSSSTTRRSSTTCSRARRRGSPSTVGTPTASGDAHVEPSPE